jgi:hypothetical protein
VEDRFTEMVTSVTSDILAKLWNKYRIDLCPVTRKTLRPWPWRARKELSGSSLQLSTPHS